MHASNDLQYIKLTTYPAEYLRSDDCQWEISTNVSVSQSIVVSFEEFHMEWQSNCTNEYVELSEKIHGSSKIIAKLCSTEGLSKTYHSSGSKIFVRYHSRIEGSSAYKGFKISFRQGMFDLIL